MIDNSTNRSFAIIKKKYATRILFKFTYNAIKTLLTVFLNEFLMHYLQLRHKTFLFLQH